MRAAYSLWLLGLSISCTGCALVEDASRNMCVALSTPIEVHREKARNRRWAEAAWQEVCMRGGGHSKDFAHGFKEGFAEYLFRGGNGEPPLVAPLHYRDARYQNPEGYQAIQDWFEGYRFGASAAQSSGARQWITGPSSLRAESHIEAPPPLHVATDQAPPELPKKANEPEPKGLASGDSSSSKAELIPVAEPTPDKPADVKARITNIGVMESAGEIREMPPDVTPLPDEVRRRVRTMTAEPIPVGKLGPDTPDEMTVRITKIGTVESAGEIREMPPDVTPLPDEVRSRLRMIALPASDDVRVRIKAIAPAVE